MPTLYTLKTQREIYSVSDITKNIRVSLERNFSEVWVEGEISNFKLHTSGHLYFSLKDEHAQIQCVMFRRETGGLGFEPSEGLKALCLGRVSVYAIRGQYQLYVERIEPKGVGLLQLKFQQLVEKLKNEGLFDEERKKPIPYLPKTIGIVTSIDGAALRDILHVLNRRFSSAHVLIYPVPVQGATAAGAIAQAIEDFNRWGNADVLIVGRGGGSLEDLWAFNEEIVARAIFASEIPLISAVGHEVDTTIADFVSDLRAPTPSAAAEMVLPVQEEILSRLKEFRGRLLEAVKETIRSRQLELEHLKENRVIRNPLGLFEVQFQRLDEFSRSLTNDIRNVLALKKENFVSLIGKLEALGPLAVMRRGFSLSMKMPTQTLVTKTSQLRIGDHIKTRLEQGHFISQIKEIGK